MWKTTGGITLSAGAIASIISYVMGATIFSETQEKIGALGAAMAGASGPPKPEQVTEMNQLQAFLMKAYRIDFVLLVIAVVSMAAARYL